MKIKLWAATAAAAALMASAGAAAATQGFDRVASPVGVSQGVSGDVDDLLLVAGFVAVATAVVVVIGGSSDNDLPDSP